jgi:transposase
MRQIVNEIFYAMRSGCSWRLDVTSRLEVNQAFYRELAQRIPDQ